MRHALGTLSYSYLKKHPQRSSNGQIGAGLGTIRGPYGDNQ